MLNAIFSGIVVFNYYINNQTASAYVTYLLYMSTKFSHVYNIAHTEKNIFYSAYLLSNVQYNDIDAKLNGQIQENRVTEHEEEKENEKEEKVKTEPTSNFEEVLL